ncbi:sugar transporter ERD6-like 7 isoform X2 [Amaranthus tricolor]|uniref:sugar transporter ERD6-like 7 isoform X2 n=1 Tax=Amaranthus tricolor TaxID=29722 RepID=UPI002583E250|nr:sugar transporter ERD6-like 7 isoform X2 [Amaranthus tricolor]
MVYISTCVAVCGSYQFGACAGYSSPTQSSITSELHLSTAQFSLFGSILTFGAMFGAITSGPLADSLGRKWVPVYIAEIAPVNIRGALTTLNQVMISTGIAVAFLIGLVISWRALALAELFPCAIMLLGLFFIPESPRWLAKREHQEEFKAALQKLRGCDADVTLEAAAIQSCIEELKQQPNASIFDLFQKKYVHCVTIGVGLMVLQQIGGINGICFYASNIFETAGFSPKIGTIVYALIQVQVPSVGATLIDKTGRKPLLLVSAIGSALGCMLTAIAFYLKVHHGHTKAGILAATGILIFPINLKGVAGSLATLVNWFGAWAVSYTFNFLMEWSSYGTFFLFGVSNALGIIFVIKVVPETNGRTLEQIQLTIKG